MPSELKKDEFCFQIKRDNHYTFLESLHLDLIFVYGWNYLIPKTVIHKFKIYNIHNSLLPKYRGPFPIVFQLLHNEYVSGVTLHKMNECFDSGDIYKQEEFRINEEDDYLSISVKAMRASAKLLNDFFVDYMDYNIHLTPQNHLQSTYYSMNDINKYIVDQNYTYNEFLKLYKIFCDHFPIKILIGSKIQILKSFELVHSDESIKYKLADKMIYIKLI